MDSMWGREGGARSCSKRESTVCTYMYVSFPNITYIHVLILFSSDEHNVQTYIKLLP